MPLSIVGVGLVSRPLQQTAAVPCQRLSCSAGCAQKTAAAEALLGPEVRFSQ